MTKKARYFFVGSPRSASINVGGAEPEDEDNYDEEDQEQISDVNILIDKIDEMDEESIDKIINHISETIDMNADKGVANFGKREYVKKVLGILDHTIQPVYSDMNGGALTEEQKKDIDELTQDIGKLAETIMKNEVDIIRDDEENESKRKYNSNEREYIKDAIISDLYELILKSESGTIYNLQKLSDILIDRLKKKDIEIYTDESAEAINNFLKSLKLTKDKKTKEIKTGKYYNSIIKLIDEKQGNYKDILNSIDTESLMKYYKNDDYYGAAPRDIEFPNVLTLYSYNDILSMSYEGYEDRVNYTKTIRESGRQILKDTIDPKTKEVIKEGIWTPTMELSLRGENGCAKSLLDIYDINENDYKYENYFQLINRDDAYARIDIIFNEGIVEVKGWKKGAIELNKFASFGKEYKRDNQHKFFAAAKPYFFDDDLNDNEIITDDKYKRKPDPFNGYTMIVLPNSLVKVLSKYSNVIDTLHEANQPGSLRKYQTARQNFIDHMTNYGFNKDIYGLSIDDSTDDNGQYKNNKDYKVYIKSNMSSNQKKATRERINKIKNKKINTKELEEILSKVL